MAGYILSGSTTHQDTYIKEYASSHAVPMHLTFTYEAPFAIAHARELRKILSLSIPKNQQRVIVIPSDMSFDAQHALLKTLEELPEDTALFVKMIQGKELLPTLHSRLFAVSLDNDIKKTGQAVKDSLETMFVSEPLHIAGAFQISNALSQVKEDPVEEVLAFLREKMIIEKSAVSYGLIERVFCDLELLYSNNLNKKMYWDSVLIHALFSRENST